MHDYRYKFSVIMPVYKVEKYVAESIESVINQTIGFKENIQLILVNDASPDNSGKICEEYVKKYPENIKYVVQKPLGVSAARNNGLSIAEGKYINFLDSDDKWEPNAFELAENYFEKYDVNILACRMKYFDRNEGFKHPLDYKFDRDRIIDITKDYKDIQMQGCTSIFYKSTCLEGRLFDISLHRAQDTAFLVRILADEKKYGIAKNIIHLYRKRSDNTSAVDTRFKMPEFYSTILENAWEMVFEISRKKFGTVLPFFQYTVMYELQWRIKNIIQNVISEEEKLRYIERIKTLLEGIEDHIIVEQRNISPAYKAFALRLKHDKQYDVESAYDFNRRKNVRIENIDVSGNNLIVECKSDVSVLGERYELIIINQDNEEYYGKTSEANEEKQIAFDGSIVDYGYTYEFRIPAVPGNNYLFVIFKDGKKHEKQLPVFNEDTGISIKEKGSFAICGGNIIEFKRGNLMISSNRLLLRIKKTILRDIRLVQKYKFKAIKIIKEKR